MTTKDIVSGLLTPILIITSTLSYAALIFSGPLKPGLAVGIGFGLVGAGLLALIFAILSGLPFAIAGPDSKPVAVLAPFAVALAAAVARRGHAADATATVLFALIAGTIVTGIALYLLGVLKAGRWIRSDAVARMERDDPALAYAFHKLVIRTLATRLDFANREVAGLRR